MAELIATAFNVFLLCFLLGYFLSDMLDNMLSKRTVRIADEINTARMSKKDAQALKEDYEGRLAAFDSEKQSILEDAQRRAKLVEAGILQDGKAEADRLVARAHKEADLCKAKLEAEVKHDIIVTANVAAASIIAKNLDEGKQAAYIQEMLDEMGESTWQI